VTGGGTDEDTIVLEECDFGEELNDLDDDLDPGVPAPEAEFKLPYDRTQPPPKIKYEFIGVLAHVQETAPKRNVWVMIDVREEAPKADQGSFDLPGVDSVIAFPQEDHGLYRVNRLHCNPHYETTLREYKSKLNKMKKLPSPVPLVYVKGGDRVSIDDGTQEAFVFLDGEFDGDIGGLQLEKIFDNLILKDNTKILSATTYWSPRRIQWATGGRQLVGPATIQRRRTPMMNLPIQTPSGERSTLLQPW
jgi:hypothetical protein